MRKQYSAANKQADTELCNFFPGTSIQTKPKKRTTPTALVFKYQSIVYEKHEYYLNKRR